MRLWWRGRVRRLRVLQGFRVHQVRAVVAMQERELTLGWRVVRQRVLLARMLPRAQQLRMRQLLAAQRVRQVEVQQRVDAAGQQVRRERVAQAAGRCARACLRG
jgi:hypothetical protein